MKLEQYQIDGANFLAPKYHALLADDMGLGKTAQTITAADQINAISILVVCPASVKYQWEEEFDMWSNRKRNIDVVVNGKFRLTGAEVVIVNYDLLLRNRLFNDLKSRVWDLLVLDEAHYVKSLTSQRSKKTLGSFGLAKEANYKWLLTGTPIENKPVDLFPMLYVLGRKYLGEYDTYEKFVMHYCDGYYDQFSGQPMPNGATNELELKERLSKFMLRRTLAEQLPKTDIQIVRMKKNLDLNSIENQGFSSDTYYKPMAELGALASLRQEVALAKLSQCIEYIKDTLKVVDKLVVFAYHRSVINQLAERLPKYFPVKFFGGLTISQRENVKNYFIKDSKCRIIIGQIKAMGTAVDGLQKVCNHAVFVEVDWTPFRQCIGRLRRKGQAADTVIVHILVCKDSIEEQMLGSVNSKLKSIDKILGD